MVLYDSDDVKSTEIKINNESDEYIAAKFTSIMNNLNLANPKMMDIAVPANVKGATLDQL